MHYNDVIFEGAPYADLETYMANPQVFTVKEGHIEVLKGSWIITLRDIFVAFLIMNNEFP